MRGHTDQLTQAPWGQLGVAVERDDVACAGLNAGRFTQIKKDVATLLRQLGDQQFQLAALALPADPALLGFAELPCAMQHNKARCLAAFIGTPGVLQVQIAYASPGPLQQGIVGVKVRRVGVGPIGQQGKLGMWLRIGQVVQLQAIHQLKGRCGTCQHAGNDHHHPVFGRDTQRQGQAGQVFWPNRFADQSVHHRHHGLRRWKQRQQHDQRHQGRRVLGVVA